MHTETERYVEINQMHDYQILYQHYTRTLFKDFPS